MVGRWSALLYLDRVRAPGIESLEKIGKKRKGERKWKNEERRSKIRDKNNRPARQSKSGRARWKRSSVS
jgi:hypothetical protein